MLWPQQTQLTILNLYSFMKPSTDAMGSLPTKQNMGQPPYKNNSQETRRAEARKTWNQEKTYTVAY